MGLVVVDSGVGRGAETSIDVVELGLAVEGVRSDTVDDAADTPETGMPTICVAAVDSRNTASATTSSTFIEPISELLLGWLLWFIQVPLSELLV